MNVSDLMQKRILSVFPESPIYEVIRIIYNVGVGAVPVVIGNKLVGMVTEADILKNAYPSVREFMEDWMKAQDFEAMKENLAGFMSRPVSKIMTTKITTVNRNCSIMHAQTLMIINKLSRLPVIDGKGNLIGIISQGDIFKYLVKKELPKIENVRFASFMKENYDWTVNWEKRLAFELPVLFSLFRKEKVKRIVDLGTWTGRDSIEGAKQGGVEVLAIDNNDLMIKISNDKREKLTEDVKKRIHFQFSQYDKLSSNIKDQYDAVICMGGAFAYIDIPLEKVLKEIRAVLKKDGIFIAQNLNFEKIIKKKDRLLSFKVQARDDESSRESIILEFIRTYNPDWIKHNVAIFDFDGFNWFFSGMTAVKAQYFRKDNLKKAFKKAGFSKVSFSGNMGEYRGDYGPLSFKDPFLPLESDWLNVLAKS